MDLNLSGTRAFVTGASGGIGQATVRALAEEGCRVAIHCNRNRESAEALSAQLGGHAVVQGDLSDEAQVDRVFAEAVAELGALDHLVVNAGIWCEEPYPLHEMSLQQWHETLNTNLTAAFLCCRAFLRHLAARSPETASIVLVGSTAGRYGEEGHADYAASKAGMTQGLMLSLKNEIIRLAPRGRVNCVNPGWVATPMAEAALQDQGAVRRATSTMALRKVAQPEDVARAIVLLCSDRASGHVSGCAFPVDGGMEGRLLHNP